MTRQPVRLAIIGAGGIARTRHIPGLGLLKRAGLDTFQVTALCDTDDGNLTTAAATVRTHLGDEPAHYRDWQACLSDAPIDAVDICLPHGLHHIVGIAALEAGLDVILEKPYTVTARTGRQLAEVADRTGRVLAVAVPHRRMPGERAVHWAINEARLIGEPRLFFANYTYHRPPAPEAAVTPALAWRRDRLMGGGGMTFDSGFHFLDTVRYFFGEVAQVYAELRSYSDDRPVASSRDIIDDRENTAVIVITFTSGLVGTWCWSQATPGRETRDCVIYGSTGSIEDTLYSNRYMVFHQFMGPGEFRGRDGAYLSLEELQTRHRAAIGPERVQQLFPNGVTDHFATELWDFHDAIVRGRPPEVDGWGGLGTVALANAIYESACAGQAVRVADVASGAYVGAWQQELDEYWSAQPIPRVKRASR